MATGLISYGFAALVFLGLSLLLIASRQRTTASGVLIFASFMTLFWAIGSSALIFYPSLLWIGTGILDALRVFSWGLFVHVLLSRASAVADEEDPVPNSKFSRSFFLTVAIGVIVLQLIVVLLPVVPLPVIQSISLSNRFSLMTILWMVGPLISLFLVEQLYFGTHAARRAAARYMCVGLAAMFLFDFALYTDSLLFKHIRFDIWQARGLLYSFLVPLVAFTVVRNPSWAVELHVSRQAVTTSVTLLGAGIYLVATAIAASLIRLGQFEGASVILVTIVVLSLVALTLTLLSKKFRARVRVSISKHFFNFKYDYRTEWLKFTRTLASNEGATPSAIVKGLCDIVDSDEGVIWGKNKDGHFTIIASIGDMLEPSSANPDLSSLENFLEKSGWIVDLEEFRESPNNYSDLTLPESISQNDKAWLIIPLPFQEQVEGYVMIGKSAVLRTINWEDRDLLKTAGHQAAGLLAQRRAHQELKEASQFEAYSKLSAYIVHDLKNILGQQSLIVSNAPRHKHKPEFVDDVIGTIDNSVNRMQSLLQQLREPTKEVPTAPIDVVSLLNQVTLSRADFKPVPVFNNHSHGEVIVTAAEDKLSRVFSHILQNAQEATADDGSVTLDLFVEEQYACINVTDTGKGMSASFINEKLFTAFESTKGLTGMGIGVFESREYIRSLGGNIAVDSEPGIGSIFRIKLPLASAIID